MNELKKHPRPVWGEEADFAVQLRIVTGDERLDNPPRYEELPCKDLGNGFYKICCVPMFLYDLALGDVLRISDGKLEGVAQESGHHTFRAYFGRAFMPFAREVLIDELAIMPGVLTEWFSDVLLGLSAENDAVANELSRWLETAMSRGQLQYETGRTH